MLKFNFIFGWTLDQIYCICRVQSEKYKTQGMTKSKDFVFCFSVSVFIDSDTHTCTHPCMHTHTQKRAVMCSNDLVSSPTAAS